jgi:hypothetical protein
MMMGMIDNVSETSSLIDNTSFIRPGYTLFDDNTVMYRWIPRIEFAAFFLSLHF